MEQSNISSTIKNAKTALWVFSDAGGAKQVLAAYKLFVSHSDKMHHFILTDRWHLFYEMFQLPVNFIPYSDINIQEIFNSLKPDLIITGTSYTSNIELKFLQESNTRNIKSISIIDHYNYPELRFNNNNLTAFPNEIFVFDELNKLNFTQLSLPSKTKVSITSNFYFNYLNHQYAPSISKGDFYLLHELNENYPLVIYAPEPLSLIKDKFNYKLDETDGLKLLLHSVSSLSFPVNIVFQCHPNQDKDLLKPFENTNWVYGKTEITNALWYSDVVISYCSNSIYEAKSLGKKTVSLFLDLLPEHFKNLNTADIGYLINTEKELTNLLKQILL